MRKKKINAIEMIRKIRDKHAQKLAGKSHADRIAFYRERARKMEKKLPVLLSHLAMVSGGKLPGSVTLWRMNISGLTKKRSGILSRIRFLTCWKL